MAWEVRAAAAASLERWREPVVGVVGGGSVGGGKGKGGERSSVEKKAKQVDAMCPPTSSSSCSKPFPRALSFRLFRFLGTGAMSIEIDLILCPSEGPEAVAAAAAATRGRKRKVG